METVLMLHGSLGARGQWRGLGERLSPRYRTLAVDLHGYGDNPLPRFRRRHTFENEVALVLRRVGEAGAAAGAMHVVGHSYGAGVALALARMYPHRVASLALYEPPCFPLLEDAHPADYLYARAVGTRVTTAIVERDPQRALRTFLDYWAGEGSLDTFAPAVREAMLARVSKCALDFDAVFSAPSDPHAYAGIDLPTLILRGRRSPREVRRALSVLARAIPGARLEELAGDHLMPVRDPEPFNRAVEQFLRRAGEGRYPAARTRDIAIYV